MDAKLIHYYKRNRAHQMAVYPSCVCRLPNGKEELTAGSSPYGEHALSAYRMAKAHIHFMKRRKQQ